MLSIDQYAHTNKLASIHANQKILLSIGALLCVWISRNLNVTIWTFVLMSFLIVYIARIPLRFYFMLLLAPASFCLLGVLSIALSFTTTSTLPSEAVWFTTIYKLTIFIVETDLIQAVQLFYTAFGTVTCLYACILTTPMYEINILLKKLRVPDIIIELMTLTYQFIFLFLDCIVKIYTAQQTRLGYQSLKNRYHSVSLLITALFREVFYRQDQLVLAMKARNIDSFLIPTNFQKKKSTSKKMTWIIVTYFSINLVLWLL